MTDSRREFAERIVRYLLAGVDDQEVKAFLETEVGRFEVRRDPRLSDLPTAPLRETLHYWQSLPRVGGVAEAAGVDPSGLGEALGYLILVEIHPQTDDFRYALYGSSLAQRAVGDVTGKSVWELPASHSVQSFLAACYMIARQLKRSVYTIHEAPTGFPACGWHRLALPLGCEGEVEKLLLCNVPMLDGQIIGSPALSAGSPKSGDDNQRNITSRAFLKDCPEEVAGLFRYWDGKRGDRSMPRRADIRPEDFRKHLPGILLVDVEGTDDKGIGIFRYRLVGTGEVALRHHDPTGKLVRDGFFGPSQEDVLRSYELARSERTFVYDPLEYTTPEGHWCDEHTIFLPLSEDGAMVTQILVYSIKRRRKPRL